MANAINIWHIITVALASIIVYTVIVMIKALNHGSLPEYNPARTIRRRNLY